MTTAKRKPRRSYGAVRKLPSGRFQASYIAPTAAASCPATFDTKGDADAWLAAQRTDISRGDGAARPPRWPGDLRHLCRRLAGHPRSHRAHPCRVHASSSPATYCPPSGPTAAR